MYQKMLNVGSGGSGGASSADKVSYDNSTSGLSADNVQGALDELGTFMGEMGEEIVYTDSRNVTVPQRAWTAVHSVDVSEGLYYVCNSLRYYQAVSSGATIGANFEVTNGTYIGSNFSMKIPNNDYVIGASGLVKVNEGGGTIKSMALWTNVSASYLIEPAQITVIRLK